MPTIQANGVELHYEDTGSGAETIVFAHGLFWDGHLFDAQVAALRDHYRCVTFDFRGQGQTPATPDGYDMETLAQDAAGLIDALGLAPVHFAGLSMGGFIGMRLAARRPELLRSLILIETSAEPEPRENLPKYRQLLSAARLVGVRPLAGRIMPIMFGRTFLRDPERADQRAAWQAKLATNKKPGILRATVGVIERPDFTPELARIHTPTLIVIGAEDAATTPEHSEHLRAHIAGAQLVSIPRAGHTSTVEEPEAVTAAIQTFLAAQSAPASPPPVREGRVAFRQFQDWYQVVGAGEAPDKLPLLVLHGGPGVPHDYLEPLGQLARTGRRVIFYDQLGCGRSDHPDDPALWTPALFVEEVGALRRALGLERVHLLGQSWGGMLAMEYALTQPAGLASLVVADSPASMRQWVSEANRLRGELPPEVQATLLRHEAAGTTDSPAYQAAMQVFYRRHVCRKDPLPDYVQRSFDQLAQAPQVYLTMNGPSEFHVIGTLKDWTIVDRLPKIAVPTLLLSGKYDEATPAIVAVLHRGIPGAEWALFEDSSHMPHVEETERFLAVLDGFLTRVEAAQR